MKRGRASHRRRSRPYQEIRRESFAGLNEVAKRLRAPEWEAALRGRAQETAPGALASKVP